MTSSRIAVHRDSPLWSALDSAIRELAASRELSINTAPEYIIEFLCRELTAKKLVVAQPIDGAPPSNPIA
jgi:hypothetical protein